MYSLKPIIPKKNPDTVSPTIPQILKFASSRNTENAKRTMSMISLLICFCLASSSSRALRSMAAFDLADVFFDAVFFFADVLLFDPPFEEFFATVFLDAAFLDVPFFDVLFLYDFLLPAAIFYLYSKS